MSITAAAMGLTIRTGRPWTSGTPSASVNDTLKGRLDLEQHGAH
jgi:hypothetical protein